MPTNDKSFYWLSVKKISAPEFLDVRGPYNTAEEATANRDKIKRSLQGLDGVSAPFVASSKEEAEKRAHLF